MIERLNIGIEWASIASAFSQVFDQGSLAARVMRTPKPSLEAIRDHIHHAWLRDTWDRWHEIDSSVLRTLSEKFGDIVASIPVADGRLVVRDVAGALVAWARPGSWSEFRSSVPLDELAQHVVTAAAFRGEARLALHGGEYENEWSISTEPSPLDVMSSAGQDLEAKLRCEIAHGPRSVLLLGPSGTGKTGLARQLAERIGGSYIVLDASASSRRAAWDVAMSLRPGALIVDDLDHALKVHRAAGSMLLSALEVTRRTIPLVIMTANSLRPIRPALLRPKRVDLIVEIVGIDKLVLDVVGAKLSADARARASASGLPAAYVDELSLRVAGGAQWDAEITELESRLALVSDGWNDVPSGEL